MIMTKADMFPSNKNRKKIKIPRNRLEKIFNFWKILKKE